MASGSNIRKSARNLMATLRAGGKSPHARLSAGGKLTATSSFGVSMINSTSNSSLKRSGVKLK
jgi:hypothetical protein